MIYKILTIGILVVIIYFIHKQIQLSNKLEILSNIVADINKKINKPDYQKNIKYDNKIKSSNNFDQLCNNNNKCELFNENYKPNIFNNYNNPSNINNCLVKPVRLSSKQSPDVPIRQNSKKNSSRYIESSSSPIETQAIDDYNIKIALPLIKLHF